MASVLDSTKGANEARVTMADLADEIRDAYEAAQAADELARQHPDHLEHAVRAAEHFERAAELSARRAATEGENDETRLIVMVFAEYYLAMMHKCRGWHAYERRDCDTALDELGQEKRHFENAVREAGSLVPALSEKGQALLRPHLESWKVSVAGLPSAEFGIRARRAWDKGDTVEAIDWYRHAVTRAEEVLELEKRVPPAVNPAARRVLRGNMYTTIANASMASARILFDQATKVQRSLYDFSRDEGLQFLGHFLDSHKAGTTAMSENPEWQQIGMAAQACRSNIEEFLRKTKENWPLIFLRYQGNSTLEMLMKQIDPERYAMAKGDKILRENKGARLWAIGSFWVFAFVCVTGMIVLLAAVVSPWVVLPCIIGIEVILLFIGALTLRGTEDLSHT